MKDGYFKVVDSLYNQFNLIKDTFIVFEEYLKHKEELIKCEKFIVEAAISADRKDPNINQIEKIAIIVEMLNEFHAILHDKELKEKTKIEKQERKRKKKLERAKKQQKNAETQLLVEIMIDGRNFIKVTHLDVPRGIPDFEVHIAGKSGIITRYFDNKEIEEFLFKELQISPYDSVHFHIVDSKSNISTKIIVMKFTTDKSKIRDFTRNALSYIDTKLITRDW